MSVPYSSLLFQKSVCPLWNPKDEKVSVPSGLSLVDSFEPRLLIHTLDVRALSLSASRVT